MDKDDNIRERLLTVYTALEEKGYDPVERIMGYLLIGNPLLITRYMNARQIMSELKSSEIIEELIKMAFIHKYEEGYGPTEKKILEENVSMIIESTEDEIIDLE